MAGNGWTIMPFDEAVLVNPPVSLERGKTYPFVDMQSVDPTSRSVGPSEIREFKGGGSRFLVGDTLMARITPCLENGKIARFVTIGTEKLGHGSTEFIVIRGRPGITDNDFAYYLTRWEGVRQYAISQMTGSSGRQRVPTDALRHLEVPLPPLDEQRAIVHILGTLDDKIELNRQMNRTLEAIARAIFKSWFVDFDPVRAKAEGRDPGLPKEIADLFPDEFQESEIGEIPKGWHTVSLSEIADIVLGGTPKTSVEEYWNGTIPWASAKDISAAAEPFIVQTERTITEAGLNNSNAKLLPAGTTVITSRGTVGRYCILGIDMAINQTNYGLLAKPKVDKYFLYFTVGHLIQELKQRSYGTVFSTITTRTLQGVTVVCPPERVMKVFRHIVSPFMDKVLHHIFEMNTLANIRDSLLPKLISGELRVPDAERILEANA